MSLKLPALTPFIDYAEHTYQQFQQTEGIKIILFYSGDLDVGFANAISSRLELLLEGEKLNKQVQKRFFSVIVEAVQNIRLHGTPADDERVHACVLVFLNAQHLCAKMMNIVTKDQANYLTNRYAEANALDRVDLKAKYLDIMQNGQISDKGGAGLGILTIVLRSQNPSDFKVMPISEAYHIFESNIRVDLE